jgi:hypothetical protein
MLRFTVRDLLWLSALVGLIVRWWLDSHVWRPAAMDEIEKFHGTVVYLETENARRQAMIDRLKAERQKAREAGE